MKFAEIGDQPSIVRQLSPPANVIPPTPSEVEKLKPIKIKLQLPQPSSSDAVVGSPSQTHNIPSRQSPTPSIPAKPAALPFTIASTSFAVASSEDVPMQELHPIDSETQRPTRSRVVVPFSKSALAVQQAAKGRRKGTPDLIHTRNLFMARINKDIIEEASGQFGRGEVNGPAFHAGIIMLDELNMHIEEQDDIVRSVKKKNKTYRETLQVAKILRKN